MASPHDDVYEERPTPPLWAWAVVAAVACVYVSAAMGWWGRL